MRQKTQFNETIDNVIKNMINEGNTLVNIKKELEDNYSFKAATSTISLRVKELGIDISKNKSKKSKIDYRKVVDMLRNYDNITDIAKAFGVDKTTINKFIDKNNLSYNNIVKIHEDLEWKENDVVDLRSMRSEEIDNMINKIGGDFTKDYVVNINNKKFITDFYCPETNTAFVYFGNDESFTKKDKCPVEVQGKWKNRFNKVCDKQSNKINVIFYLIKFDFETRQWLVDETASDLREMTR